ncbi:MAG: bifunctional (p)ppGpp synthetase/guanosine-3',5'-bis(diphosphate) 3'-pyrophosphohydrolase [Bacilli bacterium]|nr:bifunctional (p)ppGpp synthetase/guanosine-3',5'-bis(diphosphate) 3'-pyrophosphohydrolase [Bacilli bacterium]
MNELSLDDLLNKIKEYTNEDLSMIIKAYDMAEKYHGGLFRASGEPFIIHPLNVAYILAEMNCDIDTIVAGLLHDVVEDTACTLDLIEQEFNKTVSILVDGVTKISNIPFYTKQELNLANTRKIIAGAVIDIRIIIIKLADRLHNMRTLQFKSREKQIKKAKETRMIFTHLADYIGAYKIKNELEDLSFEYEKPEEYAYYYELYQEVKEDAYYCLNKMAKTIGEVLEKDKVENEILLRIKHLYGIYKKMNKGSKLSEIHDLLNLKILLPSVSECYLTLGRVHNIYHPYNDKFKDYICNPKTNLYQSIHSTVFAPDDWAVQVQLKTFDMDKIASYGLPAYFYIEKGLSRETMQDELSRGKVFQFYDHLKEICEYSDSDEEFVNNVNKELFTDMIYVYTTNGDTVELPIHSTPIDFAYHLGIMYGNQIEKVIINGEVATIDTELKTGDCVNIQTSIKARPTMEWEKSAHTIRARRRINDFNIAYNAITKK